MARHLPLLRAAIPGLILALVLTTAARAQENPFTIEKVELGFGRPESDFTDRIKAGLMGPVYVTVRAGKQGFTSTDASNTFEFQVDDSENIGAIYSTRPFSLEPEEQRVLVGYLKPGYQSPEVKVSALGGRIQLNPQRLAALPVNSHLYLSLGMRLTDLQPALDLFQKKDQQEDQGTNLTQNRYAAFEMDLAKLPDQWYGYQSVDLAVLSTSNKKFLAGLGSRAHQDRLEALAQWVQRGGRLVVPVAFENQAELDKVLGAPAWQPPIPARPPADSGDVAAHARPNLAALADWGQAQTTPFQLPGKRLSFARLDPGNLKPGDWEVLAKTDDNQPLITQVRYGLGQITYLAVPLDSGEFSGWAGRFKFLNTLIKNVGPTLSGVTPELERYGNRSSGSDLASPLLQALDTFDVKVIPFGIVALLILVYVLLVGPVDFFVLKYLVRRLELTWLTFPAVVAAVSLVAYFAAYAMKGNELSINQVDVVDIDQRTHLTREHKTARAYGLGQSFFTLLSPRIQNYTVGLQADPAFWGSAAAPVDADLVTWMGRAEADYSWGMGRGNSQSFFRHPYRYVNGAAGLKDVPIPVWTTKAFTASWQGALDHIPLQADLVYHQDAASGIAISGTLRNRFGCDLTDVWLMYDDRCFELKAPLAPGAAEATKLELTDRDAQPFSNWRNLHEHALDGAERDADGGYKGPAGAGVAMKMVLWRDRLDTSNALPNHLLRPLDLGWRVLREPSPNFGRDSRVREAILYARTRPVAGNAETLYQDRARPRPTQLWLGEVPEAGAARPALPGALKQATYVRVILPVRPADN